MALAKEKNKTLRGRKNASVEAASGDSFIQYSEARAKREFHNANLAELDERKKKSELLEAHDVQREADAAARAVRSACLSIPDRVASLLVGRTEKEIAQELRRELMAMLTDLSIEIDG